MAYSCWISWRWRAGGQRAALSSCAVRVDSSARTWDRDGEIGVRAKLSPSILNADFGHLAEQVREAESAGADYIHVDVMDGQFVPNITLGPAVVAAIRQATTIPLDLHLMIEEPRRFLPEFVAAGAGIMTVHVEAVRHLQATIS